MSKKGAYSGLVPHYYDQYLAPYLFEPYATDLVKHIDGKPIAEILELGCGTGRLTRHLVNQLAPGSKVVATDINEDMLNYAIKHLPSNNIEWMVADAQDLPFMDGLFKYVVCQFGVMFFKDKLNAYNEVFRVLKRGGTFLFSVWDSLDNNPRSALINKILIDLLKDEAPDFSIKGPYSYNNIEEIKELLSQVGFTSLNITIVSKTSRFKSNDELIKGFVEGSPLSSFLQRKSPKIKQLLESRLEEELNEQFSYYGWAIPMQAIVISATK